MTWSENRSCQVIFLVDRYDLNVGDPYSIFRRRIRFVTLHFDLFNLCFTKGKALNL